MIGHDGVDPSETDLAAFRAPLRAIYADLDAEVARLAPACELSGRCCRFEEYGHTLFLSGPEAALLLAEAPAPSRPLDDGASCPWQDARGLCSAREARPLGCRVYFCDPAYQGHAPALTETFLGRLKRLVEALNPVLELCPTPPPPETLARRKAGSRPRRPTDRAPVPPSGSRSARF